MLPQPVPSRLKKTSVDKMRRVSKTRYHIASCACRIWTLENITKEQNLWRVKCEILFSTRGMWFTVLTVADNLIVHNNMYFVSLSVSFSLNLFYKLLVSFSLFRRSIRTDVDRSVPINSAQLSCVLQDLCDMSMVAHRKLHWSGSICLTSSDTTTILHNRFLADISQNILNSYLKLVVWLFS